MPQFRKRPILVTACLWFKNGDHPDDGCIWIEGEAGRFMSEGKVVRYYRTPAEDGSRVCQHCGVRMHEHGWIDTPQGGHIVCPGDWIINEPVNKNEYYPCKPDVFAATYEPLEG
jgi:hypothetical protein